MEERFIESVSREAFQEERFKCEPSFLRVVLKRDN